MDNVSKIVVPVWMVLPYLIQEEWSIKVSVHNAVLAATNALAHQLQTACPVLKDFTFEEAMETMETIRHQGFVS